MTQPTPLTDDQIHAILDAVAEAQGARFVVIRGTGNPRFDGEWYDQDAMPRTPVGQSELIMGETRITLKATGELERRPSDGMLAAAVRPDPRA